MGINLSENALTVAKSRYFLENENWETCTRRVSEYIGNNESNKAEYINKFHETIYNMDFIPGGRILRNAGRPRGSLFNCYVLSIGDSIEEIGQFNKDSLILWSEGGGIGCNFSALRPRGSMILGKGGKSSGLVSFLKASDGLARTIESGGQRRAAALALVDISHPEVVDFIDSKLERNELSHYNISVAINSDFLDAVESDSYWEFKFKQQSFGKMKARDIWDKILDNMIQCAEPGLLNWDKLIKNNSYYFDPIVATNPCGEVPLPAYGCCNLGALNLPNFITGSVNTNWKKLESTISLAVRFLDNVTDVNKYTLKEVEIKAQNSRRIGLGIMGLAEYLFKKELKYGSEKACVEIERLMKFIRDHVYQELVKLSAEKGAFPRFDPILYTKAKFVNTLPVHLRLDIKKYGIRCVSGMAMAPTGTISLLADVTSGIEPLFSKSYIRKDKVGERIYIHHKYKEFLEQGYDIPDWFVDSHDLLPEDHFETQVIIQHFTDGAVSKTINFPSNTSKDVLDKLLLEYIKRLKGVTVYVDGSRDGQILNPMTNEEAIKHIQQSNSVSLSLDSSDVKCPSGSCSI